MVGGNHLVECLFVNEKSEKYYENRNSNISSHK